MDYRVLLIENSRIMLERLKNIIQGTKEFSLIKAWDGTGRWLKKALRIGLGKEQIINLA